ncbi:MAG: HNH endonuclease [Treponemataceae bacterium]|nr:HNH endonuclease [Treponemataceae bacterium]
MKDNQITTYFEIDHYIPKKSFENNRPELLTLYDNLVYSCKKCNIAKSNKFEGDIYSSPLDNQLFYNPSIEDFSLHFFRDSSGTISSKDAKAANMIRELRLYRPIHNLAWICEQLLDCRENIELKMRSLNSNDVLYKKLEIIKNKINDEFIKYYTYFIANYNNNSLPL